MNALDKPLISVIMPAYNCAQYIQGAIDSALKQNMPIELLVINDCSKEDLDPIMEQYAEDPRVRYLKNQRNLGAAGSRNRGISLAQGEYVAFLDSDDIWIEGKLEKQWKAMQERGCILCATARELMTPEGKNTGKIFPVKEKITYKEMLKHNSIACSSVMVKTEVAKEFPMHHDHDSHEDYIMWLEILEKYKTVCGINEPLLRYRVSNTGKSGSKWKSAKMTFKVYRYMGFGWTKSFLCFGSYAMHGIWKYFIKK